MWETKNEVLGASSRTRTLSQLLATNHESIKQNTFLFVLPYAPKALGLILLFAAFVIFSGRMWRLRPGASIAPANVIAPSPIVT